MTPFHSGLPIDAIPTIDMSPEGHTPLIAKMQSWNDKLAADVY
jgi:hypothetical protein